MSDRGDIRDELPVARLPSLRLAFEEVLEQLQEGRSVFIADPDDSTLGLLIGGGIDR